uniref:2,3-bisphosphoglycerate 3-phosphatase n=1 Tax=Periophthalmus magnuspinnatus TaxID=409849 RepID=A0A3B4BH07_9GOBI
PTPAPVRCMCWTLRSYILSYIILFLSCTYCHTYLSPPSLSGSVPDIAVHFGTKTRYEDVVRPGLNLSSAAAGCSPVHLTAVIRHGTRFPTVKNIRRIERLSRLVQSQAPRGHGAPSWLREIQEQWQQWYTEDMDGRLVEKGRADLRNLAMRLFSSFPGLLSEAGLRGGGITVKTSSKHRCVSSAEAFQEGLHQTTGTQTVVDDSLMRSFERCRGYVEGVETNATATEEVDRFKHGPELRQVRARFSTFLSFVVADLVEAAFFICSYELAIKSLYSPWCRLFTKEDAKVPTDPSLVSSVSPRLVPLQSSFCPRFVLGKSCFSPRFVFVSSSVSPASVLV